MGHTPGGYRKASRASRAAATTASGFIALLKYKPAEFNLDLLAEFKANNPRDRNVAAQLEGIVEAGVREMAAGADQAAVFAAMAEAAIVPDYNDAVARFVIENQLHWVLDVVFNEDSHSLSKDYAPQNFNILRQLTLNLIKLDPSKGSIKVKRKRAAWDLTFLQSLLLNLNLDFA